MIYSKQQSADKRKLFFYYMLIFFFVNRNFLLTGLKIYKETEESMQYSVRCLSSQRTSVCAELSITIILIFKAIWIHEGLS